VTGSCGSDSLLFLPFLPILPQSSLLEVNCWLSSEIRWPDPTICYLPFIVDCIHLEYCWWYSVEDGVIPMQFVGGILVFWWFYSWPCYLMVLCDLSLMILWRWRPLRPFDGGVTIRYSLAFVEQFITDIPWLEYWYCDYSAWLVFVGLLQSIHSWSVDSLLHLIVIHICYSWILLWAFWWFPWLNTITLLITLLIVIVIFEPYLPFCCSIYCYLTVLLPVCLVDSFQEEQWRIFRWLPYDTIYILVFVMQSFGDIHYRCHLVFWWWRFCGAITDYNFHCSPRTFLRYSSTLLGIVPDCLVMVLFCHSCSVCWLPGSVVRSDVLDGIGICSVIVIHTIPFLPTFYSILRFVFTDILPCSSSITVVLFGTFDPVIHWSLFIRGCCSFVVILDLLGPDWLRCWSVLTVLWLFHSSETLLEDSLMTVLWSELLFLSYFRCYLILFDLEFVGVVIRYNSLPLLFTTLFCVLPDFWVLFWAVPVRRWLHSVTGCYSLVPCSLTHCWLVVTRYYCSENSLAIRWFCAVITVYCISCGSIATGTLLFT